MRRPCLRADKTRARALPPAAGARCIECRHPLVRVEPGDGMPLLFGQRPDRHVLCHTLAARLHHILGLHVPPGHAIALCAGMAVRHRDWAALRALSTEWGSLVALALAVSARAES